MKCIISFIIFCSITFSQSLTFLKGYNSSSFGVTSTNVNQKLSDITSSFAAGLLNVNSDMAYHISYSNYNASKSIYDLNVGTSYQIDTGNFLSVNWLTKSISDYIVNSKLNEEIPLGRLSDNAFTIGYGHKYNDELNVGINVLYVRSAILPREHSYNGETIRKISGLFVNLNAQYLISTKKSTYLVANIQNIGGEKSYSVDTPPVSAPTYYFLGAYSTVHTSKDFYVYASTGYAKDTEEGSRTDVGAGVQFLDKYDFRLNYIADNKFEMNDNYISVGIGYKRSSYKFNLTYQTYDKNKTLFSEEQKLTFFVSYFIKK